MVLTEIQKSLYRRKKIICIFAAVFMLAILIWLIFPHIKAASGVAHWIAEALVKILTPTLNIFTSTEILTYVDWLDASADARYDPSGLIDSVLSVTKALAGIFIFIYILVDILRTASREELTLDYVLKIGIRVAITSMVIWNLDTILDSLNALFWWVISNIRALVAKSLLDLWDVEVVGSTVEWGDKLATALQEAFGDPNPFVAFWKGIYETANYIVTVLANLLFFIIAVIIKWFVIVGAQVMILKNVIELWIRKALSPLAVIGFMEPEIGGQGSALRFFKKLIACYIHIIIYCLGLPIAEYLSYSLTENFIKEIGESSVNIGSMLVFVCTNTLYLIAVVNFCKTANSLADEVAGV